MGVQTISTAAGKNGAGTTVDLRGFGATASSNTLVLLNGRRLTDIDQSGIDFSTIPRDSIQRIEITRGNSGAVLYGDGAVGGVINIVTKTGVAQPPSGRVEAGFGSFNQRELNASASASHGPFAVSVFGNGVNSDGYRVNDYVRQRNARRRHTLYRRYRQRLDQYIRRRPASRSARRAPSRRERRHQ